MSRRRVFRGPCPLRSSLRLESGLRHGSRAWSLLLARFTDGAVVWAPFQFRLLGLLLVLSDGAGPARHRRHQRVRHGGIDKAALGIDARLIFLPSPGSEKGAAGMLDLGPDGVIRHWFPLRGQGVSPTEVHPDQPVGPLPGPRGIADRKSTRLNSSHHSISYAVFCLKK